MAPLIERNLSRRLHPGAEPPSEPPGDDRATIRAIKGKGIVATITPHFAVAVIVGVGTAFFARRPDPISESTTNEARRCNESVTQLRADFTQYKAQTELHLSQIERDINQLLVRSTPHYEAPQVAPSPLDSAVSRQLQK